MKNKIVFFLSIILLVLFWGNFETALACSCVANISPCQRFGNTDTIFIGKAVEVKKEKQKVEKNIETAKEAEFTIFEVEEVVSGKKAKQIVVQNSEGSSCDTSFVRGETYLIFADGDNKIGYKTNLCSGNIPVSEAQELLSAFRNLPSEGAGGKLYGKVSESLKKRTQEFVPMAGINLKIQEIGGTQKIYNHVTDNKGNYEIILPQGKYKIIPTIPNYAYLDTDSPDPEFIKDRSCREKNFFVKNNAYLKGKIVDARGKAVADTRVELVSVDEEPTLFGGESGYSAENGEFEIYRIPSGRYTLSINFTSKPSEDQPFPTTFYPNSLKREKAKILEVGLGQSIDNVIFRLPPRLSIQKVYGTVVFPDGKPAAEITVNLQREDSDISFSYTRTDKNGKFVLSGFTGEKYNFGVDYFGGDNEKSGYTVKKSVFKLDNNTPPFRLVLEKETEEKGN